MTLRDSPDKFRLHMLVGEPSLDRLRPAYAKAENILNKIPGEKEFVRENEAEEFARALADELIAHGDGT